MNRFRGRLSLRDKLIANKRALDFMADTSDRPRLDIAIPPKRDRVRRPVDGKPVVPLEKQVLADVLDALRNDQRVALVQREQSGVFQDGDRFIRVGTPGKLDISGMLVDGRHFEIECKRPGLRPDERQQRRIETINANGGIAGCATSAEEALALLP